MKYYYDLHIHSALSPCADDDMTPNNIVNMALLSNLSIIAVTDHNSAGNVRSVQALARDSGLLVIAGLELTTAEDIHILMLFESVLDAEFAWSEISKRQMKIKNKKEIFGNQFYMDEHDKVINQEENLLIVATDITVEECVEFAAKYNGVAIPAHVDKPSNAIIAILGDIPSELGFRAIEASALCSECNIRLYEQKGYRVLRDSDSHMLGNFNEQNDNFFELEDLTESAVIGLLRQKIS